MIPSEFKTSIEELEYCLQGESEIDESLYAKELAKLINSYLRTLNEKQRYIFVGRFYFASSVEELAREIGTTPSNVYKALEKIKKGLKKSKFGCILYDNQDSGRFCGEFHSTAPHHPRIK